MARVYVRRMRLWNAKMENGFRSEAASFQWEHAMQLGRRAGTTGCDGPPRGGNADSRCPLALTIMPLEELLKTLLGLLF